MVGVSVGIEVSVGVGVVVSVGRGVGVSVGGEVAVLVGSVVPVGWLSWDSADMPSACCGLTGCSGELQPPRIIETNTISIRMVLTRLIVPSKAFRLAYQATESFEK